MAANEPPAPAAGAPRSPVSSERIQADEKVEAAMRELEGTVSRTITNAWSRFSQANLVALINAMNGDTTPSDEKINDIVLRLLPIYYEINLELSTPDILQQLSKLIASLDYQKAFKTVKIPEGQKAQYQAFLNSLPKNAPNLRPAAGPLEPAAELPALPPASRTSSIGSDYSGLGGNGLGNGLGGEGSLPNYNPTIIGNVTIIEDGRHYAITLTGYEQKKNYKDLPDNELFSDHSMITYAGVNTFNIAFKAGAIYTDREQTVVKKGEDGNLLYNHKFPMDLASPIDENNADKERFDRRMDNIYSLIRDRLVDPTNQIAFLQETKDIDQYSEQYGFDASGISVLAHERGDLAFAYRKDDMTLTPLSFTMPDGFQNVGLEEGVTTGMDGGKVGQLKITLANRIFGAIDDKKKQIMFNVHIPGLSLVEENAEMVKKRAENTLDLLIQAVKNYRAINPEYIEYGFTFCGDFNVPLVGDNYKDIYNKIDLPIYIITTIDNKSWSYIDHTRKTAPANIDCLVFFPPQVGGGEGGEGEGGEGEGGEAEGEGGEGEGGAAEGEGGELSPPARPASNQPPPLRPQVLPRTGEASAAAAAAAAGTTPLPRSPALPRADKATGKSRSRVRNLFGAPEPEAGGAAAAVSVSLPPLPANLPYITRFGSDEWQLNRDIAETFHGGPNIYDRATCKKMFGYTDDNKELGLLRKYWGVPHIMAMPISEPRAEEFRVPCEKADRGTLATMFKSYIAYYQPLIASYGGSQPAIAEQMQRQVTRAQKYIAALETTEDKPENCIDAAELAAHLAKVKPVGGPGGKPSGTAGLDDYYLMLPKIFYLLWNTQKGKKPLNFDEIVAQYKELVKGTSEMYAELKGKPADRLNIDKGLYEMATGVVELFFLLPVLFPELYGKLIPEKGLFDKWSAAGFPQPGAPAAATAGKPAIDPNALKEALKKKGIPEPVANLIGQAVEADSPEAAAELIRQALEQLQSKIDAIKTAFIELLAAKNTLNTYRAAALNANPIEELPWETAGGARNGSDAFTNFTAKLNTLTGLLELDAQIEVDVIAAETALDAAIKKARENLAAAEARAAAAVAAAPAGGEAPAAGAVNADELARLREELAAMTAEKDGLLVRVQGLQNEVGRIRQAARGFEAEVKAEDEVENATALRRLQELEAGINALAARIAELEGELAAERAAKEAAEASARDADAARDAAVEARDAAARDLAAAIAERDAALAEVAGLRAQVLALQAELEPLRAGVEAARAEAEAACDERVAGARAEAAAAAARGERDNQAELARLREEIARLQAALAAALEAAGGGANAAGRAAAAELARVTEQLRAAKAAAAAARAAQLKAEQEKADAEAVKAAAEGRIAGAEAAKAAAEQQAAAAEGRVDAAEAAVDAADERARAAEAAAGERVRAADARAAEAAAAAVAAANQIRNLQARIRDLEDALAAARAAANGAQGAQGAQAAQAARYQETINRLQGELTRARTDLGTQRATLFNEIMTAIQGGIKAFKPNIPMEEHAAFDNLTTIKAYEPAKDGDKQTSVQEAVVVMSRLKGLLDEQTRVARTVGAKDAQVAQLQGQIQQLRGQVAAAGGDTAELERLRRLLAAKEDELRALAADKDALQREAEHYRGLPEQSGALIAQATAGMRDAKAAAQHWKRLYEDCEEQRRAGAALPAPAPARPEPRPPAPLPVPQVELRTDAPRGERCMRLTYSNFYEDQVYSITVFDAYTRRVRQGFDKVMFAIQGTGREFMVEDLAQDAKNIGDALVGRAGGRSAELKVLLTKRAPKVHERLSLNRFLKGVDEAEAAGVYICAMPVDSPQGGGFRQITYAPESIADLMEKQSAWGPMAEAYNGLPEAFRDKVPVLPPAPLLEAPEPFLNYVESEADQGTLEEARAALGMIPPEELEAYLSGLPSDPVEVVADMYKDALPNLNEVWLPIMVRAEVYRTLTE